MKFGELLKKRRKDFGFSQAEVSKECQISQGNLSRYEKDKVGLDFAFACKVSRMLKWPLEEMARAYEARAK